MVGINSATMGVITSVANAQPAEKKEKPLTSVAVDLSGEATPGKAEEAKQAEGGEGSGEPGHITQLRDMIKQLQKQLAEEQKQLAMIAQQEMDETSKLAMITAKQASIATLSGQILAATQQLLEALTKSGGSSAGGMIATQA
ncbi:hypothetical protein JET64_21575 [Pseudomonas putida]|nr:hypothetical protein [Pseudomonas putida]